MTDIAALKAAALSATGGLWFVGGVRQKIDRQEALGILWYDESKKRDENIASVWYDPRNGAGTTDAKFIALANPSTILSLIDRMEALEEALTACAAILPRYRMAGKTTGDDEELDAVLERVLEALNTHPVTYLEGE